MFQIFDRLNTLGVCLSYGRALVMYEQIGHHYLDLLIRAAEKGKYIRLIGDNLNFVVGVKHESVEKHKHMVHMFASAALVHQHHFLSKPNVPEVPLSELTIRHVQVSHEDYKIIREACVKMFVDVISVFLPRLQFMRRSVPKSIISKKAEAYKNKTEVYPLPVLPYNEQYYADDVKILDYYESLVQKLVQKVESLQEEVKIHIGGDQLTRERFVWAMFLRMGNYDPKIRFAHLGPTTFEFFHLGMNYLEKAIFGGLWNNNGPLDVGTMKCEKERITRHSVDPNVMKAYDADKDYTESCINAYMIEAVMQFFGMEERNDAPTKNQPPNFQSCEEEKEWVLNTVGELVDCFVYPCWSGHEDEIICNDVEEVCEYIEVRLHNGLQARIQKGNCYVETHHQLKPDKVKDYGHYVLESGLTFRCFLQFMKAPDRKAILSIVKMMMIQLKARNPKAKYPLELLRMLVQQYSLLPMRQACQVLYACFVNRTGKADGHVPADQQMEWIVKEEKRQIKHMYSNKTQEYITSRSSALSGIASIAANFDNTAHTIVRAKKHHNQDSTSDELKIMDGLRRLKPFRHQEGRYHREFQNIQKSYPT